MAEEKTLSSKLIYDGRTVKLWVDTVQMPGGRTSIREIVEHRGVVVIVAVDVSDNVLLVNQFRQPLEKSCLSSLPAVLTARKHLKRRCAVSYRKKPATCPKR